MRYNGRMEKKRGNFFDRRKLPSPPPLPITFCSLCYAYLARHTASGVITRKGYMNASERSVEKLYARNLSLLEPPEPRTSSRSRLLLPSNDPLFARKIRYLNFEPEEF